MSILLVEKEGAEVRAAVMLRGRLYAWLGSEAAAIREGQVYAGIADRAVKGISAVFIRLPGKEYGFLPLSAGQKPPASGQRVIVQVKHPPNGNKKAMLTRDIALAGTFLVYLPFGTGVHLSGRIREEAEKSRLREIGVGLSPAAGGIILRSAALRASPEDLTDEMRLLTGQWQEISEKPAQAPALLWDGDDALAKLLREETGRLEEIVTNAPELLPAGSPCPVRIAEKPFQLYNVERRLERSLRRTVLLKSGASLVIDPCEAMTVIDVNSAMAAGGRDIGQTAAKINREAAWEIARLLRLRGIGGMILVDFIDMASDADREALMETMREALREDPVKAVVHDITALGIMEITRRRERLPLAPMQDIPCPACGGTGIHLPDHEEDTQDA